MKIGEIRIIAAFLWQMKNEHRTPFVNVNVLRDFSEYLELRSKKKGFDYELAGTGDAFIESIEGTSRFFHIMRVHNSYAGLETFIQLNHDATADELYDYYISSCEYDLRKLLTKGAEDFINRIAMEEKTYSRIAMGMCS